MFERNAAFLRLVRIGLVLVLLGAVVGAVAPGDMPFGSVLADEGEGGDDDDGEDDDDEKRGKGNAEDKVDEDDENQGKSKAKDKDHKDDDEGERVVVVPAPNVTPDAVPTSAPTPSPTVESDSLGSLRVIAMACQQNPANGVDWETACTVPVDDARFEVKALDGPLAEWFRVITSNTTGVATLDDLPPALYQVEQMRTDWCRAESDRVDADGNVIIAEGRITTIWIYNCPVAPK